MNHTQSVVSKLIGGICILAIALLCLLASSGAFPINLFDGSLMLLQPLYASRGLVPYRDYGFIYSPGLAIIYGQIFGITDAGLFLRLAWLTVFGMMMMNAGLILRLIKNPWRHAAAGFGVFIILLPILALTYSHGSEPFSLPLMAMMMLGTILYLREPSTCRSLLMLGVIAFVTTIIRWDRALILGCVELLCGLLARIVARQVMLNANVDTHEAQKQSLRLAGCGLAIVGGAFGGFLFMIVYGLLMGTLSDLWLFLFDVPARLIDMRVLPLPPFHDIMHESSLWYCSIVAIVVLAAIGLVFSKIGDNGQGRWSGFVESMAVIAAPLSVVPYALGRSDYAHFVPLCFLVIAVCLVTGFITKSRLTQLICIIMVVGLFLPLTDKLSPVYDSLIATDHLFDLGNNEFNKNLKNLTEDCTHFIPDQTKSIFIGRDNYQHFIINPIALYLARTDIRPATPFVTEDPGIQNTCDMGQRIADDIRRAAKPMIAFLASDYQWREPNATRFMTSCGRIEKVLADMPSQTLGTCSIGSHPMRVALYH
jgi:hypothetical protein